MKTSHLISMILCLTMAGVPIVNAQENGNRDEDNNIVSGPYLTNGAGANWWIGISGGLSTFFDDGVENRVSPAFDITFGKWFTPSVAMRIGYQGPVASMWMESPSVLAPAFNLEKQMYKARFGYAYVHGDLMWNISNAFSGYKETRFWDIIPYFHSGLLCTYKNSADFNTYEFAMGFGLYNTMRLGDVVDLTMDLRALGVSSRFYKADGMASEISFTLGLAFNLGKKNWLRASNYVNPEAYDRIAALEASNRALIMEKQHAQDRFRMKENENERLRTGCDADMKLLESEPCRLMGVEPESFYFKIGKTRLSKMEQAHLDSYMTNILPNVTEAKVAVFTVRADSGTGSEKRNEFLNRKRTEYLLRLLTVKYGLNVGHFEFITEIVDSDNPDLDRAIEISFR